MKKHLAIILCNILLIIVIIIFMSCLQKATKDISIWKNYYYKEIPSALKLSKFTLKSETSIMSRLTSPPDFFSEYQNNLSYIKSHSIVLEPAELNEAEIKIVEDSLALIPDFMKQCLQKRLIGMYFYENLPMAGRTQFILDDYGDEYFCISFNRNFFKANLFQGLNYFNKSYYILDDSTKVIMEVNDSFNTFLYSLIHETAHCVDYVYNITHNDPWDNVLKKSGTIKPSIPNDFTSSIWQSQEVLKDQYDFSYREELLRIFTQGEAPQILSLEKLVRIYDDLMAGPFVTFYASWIAIEDFAEFLTYYHIIVKLDQSIAIKIYHDDILVKNYTMMDNPLLSNRFDFVDTLYSDFNELY